MPKYQVELTNGKKYVVEADSPPSEEEVLAYLKGGGKQATAPPAFATKGMQAPSDPNSPEPTESEKNDELYAGSQTPYALPPTTPPGLAAASMGAMAIPAAVAFPGATANIAKGLGTFAGGSAMEYGVEQLPPWARWPARAGLAVATGIGSARTKAGSALLGRIFGGATGAAEAGAAGAAKEAAPAAATGMRALYKTLSQKPILSEAEQGQLAQLRKVFAQEASDAGMANAARGAIK